MQDRFERFVVSITELHRYLHEGSSCKMLTLQQLYEV